MSLTLSRVCQQLDRLDQEREDLKAAYRPAVAGSDGSRRRHRYARYLKAEDDPETEIYGETALRGDLNFSDMTTPLNLFRQHFTGEELHSGPSVFSCSGIVAVKHQVIPQSPKKADDGGDTDEAGSDFDRRSVLSRSSRTSRRPSTLSLLRSASQAQLNVSKPVPGPKKVPKPKTATVFPDGRMYLKINSKSPKPGVEKTPEADIPLSRAIRAALSGVWCPGAAERSRKAAAQAVIAQRAEINSKNTKRFSNSSIASASELQREVVHESQEDVKTLELTENALSRLSSLTESQRSQQSGPSTASSSPRVRKNRQSLRTGLLKESSTKWTPQPPSKSASVLSHFSIDSSGQRRQRTKSPVKVTEGDLEANGPGVYNRELLRQTNKTMNLLRQTGKAGLMGTNKGVRESVDSRNKMRNITKHIGTIDFEHLGTGEVVAPTHLLGFHVPDKVPPPKVELSKALQRQSCQAWDEIHHLMQFEVHKPKTREVPLANKKPLSENTKFRDSTGSLPSTTDDDDYYTKPGTPDKEVGVSSGFGRVRSKVQAATSVEQSNIPTEKITTPVIDSGSTIPMSSDCRGTLIFPFEARDISVSCEYSESACPTKFGFTIQLGTSDFAAQTLNADEEIDDEPTETNDVTEETGSNSDGPSINDFADKSTVPFQRWKFDVKLSLDESGRPKSDEVISPRSQSVTQVEAAMQNEQRLASEVCLRNCKVDSNDYLLFALPKAIPDYDGNVDELSPSSCEPLAYEYQRLVDPEDIFHMSSHQLEGCTVHVEVRPTYPRKNPIYFSLRCDE